MYLRLWYSKNKKGWSPIQVTGVSTTQALQLFFEKKNP
jgi:hypothetical protein